MSIRIIETGKRASKQELKRLNEQMGGCLPEDYRVFLQKHNGGVPETNEFDIPGTGERRSGVNEFLTVSEVAVEKARLQDRFLPGAWPIAYAECGDYVCLVLGEKAGIYFWDHEFMANEGENPSWRNMFLLAKTFGGFFEKLRKFDVNSIELKPGEVEDVWVDPDFKPEF